MANNINYEYVNKTSIEPELICVICNAPFVDPKCTPCNHSFCGDCITRWINGGNLSCPMCHKNIGSITGLVQATRIVRKLVDHLPVKCLLCDTVGIQRCAFDEHMSKGCSKVYVTCPSADIKCPWRGSRDQLNDHVVTCVFQPLRPILSGLLTENQQLKEQMKVQAGKIDRLMDQLSNNMNIQPNNSLVKSLSNPCDNCHSCHHLCAAGGNPAGYYRVYAYNMTICDYDGHPKNGVSIDYCNCCCHK